MPGKKYALELEANLEEADKSPTTWYRLLQGSFRGGTNGYRTQCELQVLASGLHECVTFDFNYMVNLQYGTSLDIYGHDSFLDERKGVVKFRLVEHSNYVFYLDMKIDHDAVPVDRTWTVNLKVVEGGSAISAPTTFLEKITTTTGIVDSREYDIGRAVFAIMPSSNASPFTILSTGNVGIGKTNPGAALDVSGDVEISSDLAVNTDTLFVDSVGGRVGIGIVNPGADLTIKSGASQVVDMESLGNKFGFRFATQSATNNSTRTFRSGIYFDNDDGYGAHDIKFCMTGVTGIDYKNLTIASTDAAMTIQRGTRNVGIGTTNPAAKLDISLKSGTGSSTTPGLVIRNFTSDHTQVANGIGSSIQFYTNRGSGGQSVSPSAEIKGYIYSGAGTSVDYHALDIDVFGDNSSRNRGISIYSTNNTGNPAKTIMYGSVGIGTTLPATKLQVYDDTNTKSLLNVRAGSGTSARTEINSGIRFDYNSIEYYGAGGSPNGNREYHIRFNSGRKMALFYTYDDLQFWWGSGGSYLARASVGHNGAFGFTFTGQHRNFIRDVPYGDVIDKQMGGLIVCANNNEYVKITGGIEKGSNAITQNEALPIVSLSTKALDKSCFGVISESEDPNSNRMGSLGMFKSYYDTEDGDKRVVINSVGEGAIWVTNINGSLESGDYITTSNVVGYGQKQDSEFLANYTVAKITMDCDFDPVTQPVQIIRKELVDVNYWVKTTYENVPEEEYSNLNEENRTTTTETIYTNEDGETFAEQDEQSTYTELTRTVYQKIIKEESKMEQEGWDFEVRQEYVNVLDEHGQLQWEDDPSGATEKVYKIRYLDADGNITDEANHVYKAAFVGCTYHCG